MKNGQWSKRNNFGLLWIWFFSGNDCSQIQEAGSGSSGSVLALENFELIWTDRYADLADLVRGPGLLWLRFWNWGILCLYRWKRLINNSNVKLLNTPVTEQIVLILFRSINELQRTETSSLLKLVMDSSSGSGSNNGSGTLAEKIVKIGIELLPRNITILSTENEFRSDRTWLFSGEGLLEGQNTLVSVLKVVADIDPDLKIQDGEYDSNSMWGE